MAFKTTNIKLIPQHARYVGCRLLVHAFISLNNGTLTAVTLIVTNHMPQRMFGYEL
jgi:hypothetical protein